MNNQKKQNKTKLKVGVWVQPKILQKSQTQLINLFILAIIRWLNIPTFLTVQVYTGLSITFTQKVFCLEVNSMVTPTINKDSLFLNHR